MSPATARRYSFAERGGSLRVVGSQALAQARVGALVASLEFPQAGVARRAWAIGLGLVEVVALAVVSSFGLELLDSP